MLYSRFLLVIYFIYTFLVAQTVKNLPAMQETWVRSLGWEDPLEEGMATHSGILFFFLIVLSYFIIIIIFTLQCCIGLPGESPKAEEPGGLQFMGLQRGWICI